MGSPAGNRNRCTLCSRRDRTRLLVDIMIARENETRARTYNRQRGAVEPTTLLLILCCTVLHFRKHTFGAYTTGTPIQTPSCAFFFLLVPILQRTESTTFCASEAKFDLKKKNRRAKGKAGHGFQRATRVEGACTGLSKERQPLCLVCVPGSATSRA